MTKRGTRCKLRGRYESSKNDDDDVDTAALFCAVHLRKDREEKRAPDCPVCLSKIMRPRDATETPCHHRYHRQCLDRWLRRGATTCPTCRGTIQNPYVASAAAATSTPPLPPPQQHQQQQQRRRPAEDDDENDDDDDNGDGPAATAHVAVALDLRQLLDMIVQLTPHHDDHQFYSHALFQQVTHPLMTQYLPPDREIRDLIAGVASRSPSSNVFIRFLEDMNII